MAEKKEEVKKEAVDLKFDQKDIDENKIYGAVGYLGILFLIPLLAKKESKFAMACAKQGMILTICQIISGFLVPVFGLGVILNLVIVVIMIIGFIMGLSGKYLRIPLVGQIGESFKI
ncbi:MAG: hypothetical protein WC570_01680 [Patescibacteria group bacterium]